MTHTDPHPGKPAVEVSFGERQLAALGFVAFLILGTVAALAYVAGRAVTPPTSTAARRVAPVELKAAAAPAIKPVEKSNVSSASSSKVEQLIMVEAATSAAPAVAPSVLSAKAAEPPPVVQPSPITATPNLKPVSPELLAGNTFWQVAATEVGMAEVTCELLTRKGLPALMGDSPSKGIVRVLVGPVRTPADSNKFKATLDEAGFHPFIKKY
jgi:hypothetical protein